jgi:hypothetical protein
MTAKDDSLAVKLARAHVKSWSHKDWDGARAALSPDVHLVTTSPTPDIPLTDLTGANEYMTGLQHWAGTILSGGVTEISSVGDDHYALLSLVVEADFGYGPVTNPCARLYRFDDDEKLAEENVVFFVTS